MDALAILQLVSTILSAVSTALPEIEQDIADVKALNSQSDPAAVTAAIIQAHADTLVLTAKLDALKTVVGA